MYVRLATARDRRKTSELIALAFGQHGESLLVDDLRDHGDVVYEWVATVLDEVVGHLALSRLVSPLNCLALAPVSVSPFRQRQGVGSALIHAALELAEEDEWTAVFVHGDPKYYNKFGFDVSQAGGFDSPYPHDFTAAAVLDAGAFASLKRELVYPTAFAGV
ncbi:MAG: N-acetyltransferase [Rhodobacteraceae bacterium]|nr:N-acetyltransferase [Paracoccaceae bacterium]